MTEMLSTHNHDRDVAHLTYVYPVVSRRAGGVSLGINLNPNNACNWACVYCQVPNLRRGVPPAADLALLEQELDGFLQQLIYGSYMREHVPAQCRELKDLAISGNGEPTTCPNFAEAVAVIVRLKDKYALPIPLRLITNGSSVHKDHVQDGLKCMAKHQGEVWLKVDTIGEGQTLALNGVKVSPAWQLAQLAKASLACPTWLQTCVLTEQSERKDFMVDYLAWLQQALAKGLNIHGVLLYGLARPSLQVGGASLRSPNQHWMQDFAQKIESLGLDVKVS